MLSKTNSSEHLLLIQKHKRASMSLARLWRDQGKPAARAVRWYSGLRKGSTRAI